MKDTLIYALSVKERVEILRDKHMFLETDKVFLDRWHNIRGLSMLDDLEFLLKSQNMTIDEFTYAIKPFSKLDEKVLNNSLEKYNWYIEIDRVLNQYFENKDTLGIEIPLDISYIVRPFLDDFSIFLRNLTSELGKKNLLVSIDAVQNVIQQVSKVLVGLVIKVVSIDFQNIKNEESNKGDYEQYLKDKYGTRESLTQFYSDYPVMTRLMIERLIVLKGRIKKGFTSLIENAKELKERYNIDVQENTIIEISFDESEEISTDQNPMIYTFKASKKIVYTPKKLEIEYCFYEFVKWINNQIGEYPELLDLPISNAVYREDFTLNKDFENYDIFKSEHEKKNYYKRFGQLSVILYLLGANEFSYGNVVENQRMPYINGETLFQLGVALEGISDELESEIQNDALLSEIPSKKNTTFDDEKLPFIDYFKEGVNVMSNFILNNKENIVSKIQVFFSPKVKVRQYLKATEHYLQFMQFLNHPNYLKDMFYLEKLLDNSLAYPYKDKRVCVFEIDSMRQGNIPSFYTELGSTDVITTSGERISDYFEQTPFKKVMDRIKSFNLSDMDKQVEGIMAYLNASKEKDEV